METILGWDPSSILKSMDLRYKDPQEAAVYQESST